jgi:hypothetical protein
MAQPTNRQKLKALFVQLDKLQKQILEVGALAEKEPIEFDGSAVTVGQRVVITITKDKVASEVEATVLAVKKAEAGVKGPGTMVKVQTGEGFDIETRVVYPAQILRAVPEAASLAA